MSDIAVQYYEIFKNALAFTVAINAVQVYSDSNKVDLVILAFTTWILNVFVLVVLSSLRSLYHDLKAEQKEFWCGPVSALEYTLNIMANILVHFLSTTLGRWAFLVFGDQTTDPVSTAIIVISLLVMLWILAVTAGFVKLKDL